MQTILLVTREKHNFYPDVANYCLFLLYDMNLYGPESQCFCLTYHVTFLWDNTGKLFLNYGLITKNCLRQIKWYIIYSPEKFRAKPCMHKHGSLVETMLILCFQNGFQVIESCLLNLTLNLQLCKTIAVSQYHLNWGAMENTFQFLTFYSIH